MRLPDKLLNPFALVGQGFVLGAVLFFATSHADAARPTPATPAPAAAHVQR